MPRPGKDPVSIGRKKVDDILKDIYGPPRAGNTGETCIPDELRRERYDVFDDGESWRYCIPENARAESYPRPPAFDDFRNRDSGANATPVDPECIREWTSAPPEHRGELWNACPEMPTLPHESGVGLPEEYAPAAGGESSGLITWNFDVCAWYQPIHYYQQDYGIFVRRSCVKSIGREILRYLAHTAPGALTPDTYRYCLVGAFWALQLHEYYHHKVESFALRLEIAQAVDPRHHHYLTYNDLVYRGLLQRNSGPLYEEALANAYSYRELGQARYRTFFPDTIHKAIRHCLQNSFKHMPNGYRDADLFLSHDAFRRGEMALQQQVLEAKAQPRYHGDAWRSAPDMMRAQLEKDEIPVFLV